MWNVVPHELSKQASGANDQLYEPSPGAYEGLQQARTSTNINPVYTSNYDYVESNMPK